MWYLPLTATSFSFSDLEGDCSDDNWGTDGDIYSDSDEEESEASGPGSCHVCVDNGSHFRSRKDPYLTDPYLCDPYLTDPEWARYFTAWQTGGKLDDLIQCTVNYGPAVDAMRAQCRRDLQALVQGAVRDNEATKECWCCFNPVTPQLGAPPVRVLVLTWEAPFVVEVQRQNCDKCKVILAPHTQQSTILFMSLNPDDLQRPSSVRPAAVDCFPMNPCLSLELAGAGGMAGVASVYGVYVAFTMLRPCCAFYKREYLSYAR